MMPLGTISQRTVPVEQVEQERRRREQERVVDLSALSGDELRSLESSDPFLFHSIPEVHRAKLSLKEMDLDSDLSSYYAPASSSRQSRHPSPSPAAGDAAAGSKRPPRRMSRRKTGSTLNSSINSLSSSIVSRKSRVSTECHASLLMEDLLDDESLFGDDMVSLGDSANDVDDLMDSLMGCSFQEIDELVREEERRSSQATSAGTRRASRRSTYLLD